MKALAAFCLAAAFAIASAWSEVSSSGTRVLEESSTENCVAEVVKAIWTSDLCWSGFALLGVLCPDQKPCISPPTPLVSNWYFHILEPMSKLCDWLLQWFSPLR